MRSAAGEWLGAPSAGSSGKTGASGFPAACARLLAAAALLLAAGCLGPRSAPAPSGTPPLRVGTVADFPPIAFVHDGEWLGVEADMARRLADRLDRRLEWRTYPAGELGTALRSGEIDIAMAGLAVTPERRAVLDFSRPYLASGLGALARAGDAGRYPTALDVQSAAVPVGALRGSRAEAWSRRYLARASVRVFDTPDDALLALRERRINLFVGEAPALWPLAEMDPRGLGMTPALMDRTDLAWAFAPSSPALREAANQALSDWIRDGTLSSLLRLWFPVTR